MNISSDSWVTGDAYESFMGRWSRQVAGLFLDWLGASPGLHWLEVGCGTGALTQSICRHSQPVTLVACDPSSDFVGYAGNAVGDCHVTFVVTNADNLPVRDDGFDLVVSGLVLNFLSQPSNAVRFLMDRLRPNGILAAYVWDYTKGMEFLRIFWDEATALDPSAALLDEDRRFPLCQPALLSDLFQTAGLSSVATTSLRIETAFHNFDEFWSPFRVGTGPAPSYVASLEPAAQNHLALRLKQRLQAFDNRPIRLSARAFAVRGTIPS